MRCQKNGLRLHVLLSDTGAVSGPDRLISLLMSTMHGTCLPWAEGALSVRGSWHPRVWSTLDLLKFYSPVVPSIELDHMHEVKLRCFALEA